MREPKWLYSKTFGIYIVGGVLFLFCLGRGIHIYHKEIQIDFTSFVACAYALCRGQDFYAVENMPYYEWTDPIIVFPGMLLFYIPFTFMDIETARMIHFIASMVAVGFIYVWIYRLSGLLDRLNFKKPDLHTLLFFVGFFLFFNSSPVLMTLRHGQQPVWIMLALLLFFTFSNRYGRTTLFGLSTILKYSMYSLFAPALWIKKQYYICLSAFVLFVVLCCYPVLFGYNLIDLYRQYVDVMVKVVGKGFCSFKISGYNMLQIDFFQMSWLNSLGKLLFAGIFCPILWKEWKKEHIGLNFILVLLCFTMLLSYHRLYDNLPIMLLLIVKTHFLVYRKDWLNVCICSVFLLFYLIPLSMIFMVSNAVGSALPALNHYILLTRFAPYEHLLPIPSISQIILTIYAYYLYIKTPEEFVFKLSPTAGEDS